MANPAEPSGAPRGKLSADDLIALNQEIAGMAKAGMPLDKGLAALAHGMGRGRLQQVTKRLADDLASGCTLPQALERQPGRVPPYYAAILAAGIRSGRIAEVLATLTTYSRMLAEFRASVFSALVYPAVVMALGVCLLVGTGVWVLPGFIGVFERMHLRLPWTTNALIFIGAHPIETIVLPVAVVLGVPTVLRMLLALYPGGGTIWARLVYSLPLVGAMVRAARFAAFADLLAILVDQSVPLPEALALAGQASTDPLLAGGVKRALKDVDQGQRLGEALARQRMMPSLVVWMTIFGEKQGMLGPTLHHVAQVYRRQADYRASLLRAVLPSLLLIFLAAVLVSVFVFGLLGPMFSLLEGLSGGKKL
jgi:type II secretory pathway component PulF